jgi:transposase InsO family protein
MRKPSQDNYGLTQEDIDWCKNREKEINELSYKKFVNKIWIWIIPILALGFAFRCSQVLIENWRKEYNHIRPHSSLGYKPPAPEAIQPVKVEILT